MYIDFQQNSSSAATTQPRSPVSTSTCSHEQLSALEWSGVALARQDRLSTQRVPGRIAIAMGGLFGASHSPLLACAPLEALRQIAVLSWHRGFAVHASEIAAFTNAGLSLNQYELLVSSISRARAVSAKCKCDARDRRDPSGERGGRPEGRATLDHTVTKGSLLWAVFARLKPGEFYMVVDHAAAAAEVAAAGFMLDAESALLASPDDPHAAKLFDPAIKRKTDRLAYRFVRL